MSLVPVAKPFKRPIYRDMVDLYKCLTSFLSHVFHSLETQRKITICLSPTFGVVQFGKVVHEFQPGYEIFRSLTLTVSLITPSFFFFFCSPMRYYVYTTV